MNLIDRYILKQFVMTLVFAIVALCIIFLFVNLMDKLDDFIDEKVPFWIITQYYLAFFPEILKILTPVATMLATLFTIGRLSSQNEITAMKSGGQSLYRMMLPLVAFSLLLSAGQLYFNGWIVPAANQKKIEIERVYLNKGNNGEALYNLYFRDNPTRNVLMQFYMASERQGNTVAVEDYTSEQNPRLKRRIEAEKIVWDTVATSWILMDGISREYQGESVTTKRFAKMPIHLTIRHHQLLQLKRLPEEMNFDEIKEYIEIMRLGGKDIRKALIDYYGQYAFPLANFIVVLFGVPFASVKKKGGIAIQIGAAMIIAFSYLIFSKLSQTIGYSANIDPILTGWVANIIFFAAGIVNIIKTKT